MSRQQYKFHRLELRGFQAEVRRYEANLEDEKKAERKQKHTYLIARLWQPAKDGYYIKMFLAPKAGLVPDRRYRQPMKMDKAYQIEERTQTARQVWERAGLQVTA